MTSERTFDLQERLIDYAVTIIKMTDRLSNCWAGRHICSQLHRSGTSAAPNYGEAQSAESRADFVHKLKVALKELRETEVWLKIAIRGQLLKCDDATTALLAETDSLIAILFTCIETAKRNDRLS